MPVSTYEEALSKASVLGIDTTGFQDCEHEIVVLFLSEQHKSFFTSKLLRHRAKLRINVVDNDYILETCSHHHPVLIVLGDHELSASEARLIRQIKSRGAMVFTLIIFSQGYFEIPEDEMLGYSRQLKNTNAVCGPYTVAFEDWELAAWSEDFSRYVTTVRNVLGLIKLHALLTVAQERISEMVKSTSEAAASVDNYFEVSLYGRVVAQLDSLAKETDRFRAKELHELRQLQWSQFTLIQRDNSKRVVAKRFPNLAKTWWASEFGVSYLQAGARVLAFLQFLEAKPNLAYWSNAISASREMLDLSTTLSVLGTFSAGKTTLINTLLGTSLRTTSSHNTAILTEICYQSSGLDRVVFQYRRDVSIKVVDLAHDSDFALYPPCEGKVTSIYRLGDYCIVCIEDYNGQVRPVPIGERELSPDLQVGQTVTERTRLTVGVDREMVEEHRWLRALGQEEASAVVKLLEAKAIANPRIYIVSTGRRASNEICGVKECIKYLKRIVPYLPVRYGAMRPAGTPLSETMEITLTGQRVDNAIQYESIVLDDRGWVEYQGDEVSCGYAESPLCYLFLDKSSLLLRNDFLRLAKVVDTPGLGSMTELHDELTERYLMKSGGIVLVMIKIDMQVQKGELAKTLALLASLHRRNGNFEDVYFLCNWWRNLERNPVSKLQEIRKLVTECGFNERRVYLCDLESVIKNGVEDAEVMGFPSYGLLKGELQKRIASLGPAVMLKRVQALWQEAVRGQIANESRNLESLKNDKAHRDRRIRALEVLLSEVRDRELDMHAYLTTLLGYKQESASVVQLLDDLDSWTKHKEQLVDAAEVLSSLYTSEDVEDVFRSEALRMKRKLSECGLQVDISTYPKSKLGGLPTHALRSRIERIIGEWPFITFPWGGYRAERRREVERWFDENVLALHTDTERYLQSCAKWFTQYRRTCCGHIEKELDSLRNWSEQELQLCERRLSELRIDVSPRWDKVSRLIDNVLSEG